MSARNTTYINHSLDQHFFLWGLTSQTMAKPRAQQQLTSMPKEKHVDMVWRACYSKFLRSHSAIVMVPTTALATMPPVSATFFYYRKKKEADTTIPT